MTDCGKPAQPVSAELVRVRKLKAVLSNLLDPSFNITDDTVLDKLFTYLCHHSKNIDEKTRLSELSVFIPWLCLVRKNWPNLKSGVRAFAMRIAGFVGSQTTGFFALYESEILRTLCCLVKEDDCKDDFSVLFGYANMLTSIITHSSGLHWVIEAGVWRDMVQLALNSQRLYTWRCSCRFVSSVVIAIQKTDVSLCHRVLDMAFAPLRWQQSEASSIEEGSAAGSPRAAPPGSIPLLGDPPAGRNTLMASLKFGSEFLLALLNARLGPEKIAAIIERYKLEDWAWVRLHDENKDVELITLISRLLCLIHTTTISYNEKGEVPYKVMRGLTLLALKHLHVVILKHFFTLVLDVCVEYQVLWHKYGSAISFTDEEKQHDVFYIENNLIITQAMPTFICMKVTRVMESDVMDLFADKIFTLSCTETQRVCYAYRDCLRETTDRSIEALCLQGILSFSRVTSVVKKEQAVMAFQCMMHTLKEFVPEEISDILADCIVARRHSQSLVTRFPSILCALLDGLIRFISAFQFNWRDSLETVCILNFLQGLIINPNISPMLCSKALQLTRLVIVSFIPPNLALLVDTLQGSSIGDLGKQLFKKLHDIHWEVRDSVLEVLQAISSLADAKFPAFQTLLIENDLPRVTVAIATGDSESYVRASGLNCLREMVKIQHIWDTSLYNQKILDKVLRMLQHDTEGLVRYQASLLVTAVYKHQTVPGTLLERVYDIMYHIAIYDLHWEVKIGALEFWDAVIDNAETQEGMIDGVFPGITFSRQARKIVTLNPPEIRNRLVRILRLLSTIGCLHVLWKTLTDDCDLEVVKKSASIIKKLMNLLKKYEVKKGMTKEKQVIEAIYHTVSSEGGLAYNKLECNILDDSSEDDTSKKEVLSVPKTDDIIEQIVNEEDINLLSSKIQYGKLSDCGIDLNPRIIFPPEEFLEGIELMDLDEFLTEKKRWVSTSSDNLESLMDDVLMTAATDNRGLDHHNIVDCY